MGYSYFCSRVTTDFVVYSVRRYLRTRLSDSLCFDKSLSVLLSLGQELF